MTSRMPRAPMTVRAQVDVDLDAVRDCVGVLRSRVGSAAVMAVVKADAYGHGAVPCARAALDGGATWLGVAYVDEARQLRAAGIDAPVLVLVEPTDDDVVAAAALGVDIGVGSAQSLAAAVAARPHADGPVGVHLKVDTGLSRGGALPGDWSQLCAQASRAEADGAIRVVGVWSHLACADQPRHASVAAQLASFREAVSIAEGLGLTPDLRHLANSAGTLGVPQSHFDLVRPGISVYGLSPGHEVGTSASLGLRPAMRLRARIALTKDVPAGTGVSYGHRHVTSSDTRLALVPVGYADGIPRCAAGRAEVLVGGRRRTIAGTVCMDQLVVEVGHDEVSTGDEAIVFGPGDDGEPTADEWARSVGTIGYEVVTRVGARVPRVHVGGGAA
ncbi:MAG TPA: alanine racemase [Mycobacteriales bacterium]|nr:alanine racemase [Mycobacteriales bacterium]